LKCRDIDVLKRDRKNAQGNNGNTNVEELHLAAEVVNKKEGPTTYVRIRHSLESWKETGRGLRV